MTLEALTPGEARSLLARGATLIDVRGADEHARERIAEACHVPLDELKRLPAGDGPLIFHCRSGMRTTANAAELRRAAADRPAYVLAGGLEAWRSAGHGVERDRGRPIELMRQVQIVAGTLVLIGVLLGLFVAPGFFGLAAFVGAGLVFAGASGWCGMARLLQAMPWNRVAGAA